MGWFPRTGAVLLLATIGWLAPEIALAESSYLTRLAPPADPSALRNFSDILLKPIGRVDFRMEYESEPETGGFGEFYNATIEGYSVFASEGDLIRRDDHVLTITMVAGRKGTSANRKAVLRWNGALLATTLLDRKARFKSIGLKLGSLGDPDSLDLPSGVSRNQILQLVGPLAAMTISTANQTRAPLPENSIAVGDALLPTSPLEAKLWLFDEVMLPYMRGTTGGEFSASEREKFLNQLPTPRWRNDARIRGITRRDGFDYIDYGGFLDLEVGTVEKKEGFTGEVRSLIDPFSGIVRSAAAEGVVSGTAENGSIERYRMRTRVDTLIEQKIASPAAQPAQLPATAAIPPTAPTGSPLAPLAPPPPPATSTIADIYDRSLPSVVTVVAGNSQGSGFFVADGVVVTNEHVVRKEKNVTVFTSDGHSHKGQVLRTDKGADIAFLQVKVSKRPLTLATDLPRTGEQALVIGSPRGLEGTLTGGLVSSMRTFDGVKFVQIDAPINHGNSGGPVLDISGRVIGIATWKPVSPVQGIEGLGFAVSAIEIRKRYLN